MPICHDGYMGTAPDLSGSISKNRFRNELFWGIDRLLTCLDSGIDSFAVVFDYRCDIELHLDDRYEFYQVKPAEKEHLESLGLHGFQKGASQLSLDFMSLTMRLRIAL